MDIVYLNGHYLPKETASISIMDRGFLFGDAVYEVIPVYDGKIFLVEQHLDRLYNSFEKILLALSLSKSQWTDILATLVKRNEHLGRDQAIYLQVTRGAPALRNHAFPKTDPTLLAFCYPLKQLPYETLCQGLAAITRNDTRWQYCDIKSTSLLPNVLLYQEAINQFAVETILIREGMAIEGATSNLFIVKNEIIKTPPLSNAILAGITRSLVLKLADGHFRTIEESILESELLAADEVWITSSTREIYPITKINNQLIGKGLPGPVWHKMAKIYKDYTRKSN